MTEPKWLEDARAAAKEIERLEIENENLRAQLKALESVVPENTALRQKLEATEKLVKARMDAAFALGFCERQAADLELKQADEQAQAVTDALIKEGNGLDKDF